MDTQKQFDLLLNTVVKAFIENIDVGPDALKDEVFPETQISAEGLPRLLFVCCVALCVVCISFFLCISMCCTCECGHAYLCAH